MQIAAQEWISGFPGLAALEPSLREPLQKAGRIVMLNPGAVIFGPGKAPNALLLLLDGSIRVQQTSAQGREIVLYRISAGESCVLTTACLLAYEDYAATAIAETDVRAVSIPRGIFDEMIASSSEFRKFVFRAYSQRITELFKVVQDVAFGRVDVRLAQKLLARADSSLLVKAKHGDLATDLGTAREVVSRVLTEFQRRQWISLSRGEVQILQVEKLSSTAHSE
jgi:CRP/FNR family transcriptional regulator, anaerobic regulatory protein